MSKSKSDNSGSDWWARIFGLFGIGLAIWSIQVSNKGAPDYYAAPHNLSYSFTQSNLLRLTEPNGLGEPLKGAIVVQITNHDSTPARNVSVVITPISDSPTIKANQHYKIQDAAFSSKILTIERIPPGEDAVIEVVEFVDHYPESFGKSPLGHAELKYQYFPLVDEVQTEFGSVRCDFKQCAVFCLPLDDDNKEFSNHIGDDKRAQMEKMIQGMEFIERE